MTKAEGIYGSDIRLQVVGITRFSYPANIEAFNHSASTLQELQEVLYAHERLDQRIHLFEQITLPAIRGQSDKDFALAILIGENLPSKYQEKLEALTGDIQQVHLVRKPEGSGHKEICLEILTSMRDAQSDLIAEFRLDDDDAVAVDFVERTRTIAMEIWPLVRSQKRVELDFCRGFLLDVKGPRATAREIVVPHWTPAQVYFCLPNSPLSIMSYRHTRFWTGNTSLSEAKPIMFVRGVHGDNDSSVNFKKLKKSIRHMPEERVLKFLKQRFLIDIEKI
ncbi:Putative rhamnosyl transferase [Thalassovita taeanensis]|uniref:Putative rhamnosyl transferase n=1 Tax=Thalassovita taeanensis TaxID=657014 RepID=A0A1H9LEX9_9RHOB|nr:Putative rhamnosyl transferase [Thalassovita taeanensis]